MPVALDPSETVPIVLAVDADKPADQQAVFIAHFLTCRETLSYNRILAEARALPADQPDKENELLDKALAVALVGWRNVRDRQGKEIPFSIGVVGDVLTPREKWHLAVTIPDKLFLAEREKKAYASSRQSAQGASAPTAAKENVSTPQAS